MNLKIEYVLSKYYAYYECFNSYPYTISEKVGGSCDKVITHSGCCSLEVPSFLCLCQIIDVTDESEFSYLLCKTKRLVGNQAIRAGSKSRPTEILARESMCITLVILAMFTDQFKKNTIILKSFANILTNKNLESDAVAQEFLDKYLEGGDYFTYSAEIGIMIQQLFEKCENNEKFPKNINIYELKEFLHKSLKKMVKQTEDINEYQECS